jgi:hypothetical protein
MSGVLDVSHRTPPALNGRRFSVLACVLVVAFGLLLGAEQARAADVAVTSTPSSSAIPQGFLGISTEVQDLEAYAGTNPKAVDPAFLRLLGAIAPGQRPVLRIGGDSTDWSWYPIAGHPTPKGVTYAIKRRWLQVARATAQDLNGKLIVGVNLEADSTSDAVGEADAMVHTIGRSYIDAMGMHGQLIMDLNLEAADKTYTLEEARAMLKYIGASNILAMEIGNEPELYHHFAWYHTKAGRPVFGRPASWSLPIYRTEFSTVSAAMPQVPIAGPVSGIGLWLDQLGTFLSDEPKVSLVTMHAYPLKHCTPSHIVTIPEVLANSASAGFVSEVTPYVRIAEAHHKPIRIDEVNAISCGGTAGVSDSFASALWMENTLFGLAQTGVGGVNVHMTPGAINAILNPVRGAITVQPEYYAMVMFAQAAPPGSHIMRLHVAGLPSDEQAWATRDASGTTRVVLIDKSGSTPDDTTIRVPGAAGPATIETLRARSLASTEGVTLGGQTYGDATTTGELADTAVDPTVRPVHGAYSVHVGAASVELLTFHPPATKLLVSTLSAGDLLTPLMASW